MATTYEYKPGGMRLGVTLVLLALHIVLLFVSIGSSAMQYEMLNRAGIGAGITEEEATTNDQRERMIGLVQIAVFLVLAIFFLATLYRANANAHALGAKDLSYTPGWTVGWFFIPILNLFKPYLAVRDTWRASDPTHRDWAENRTSPLLPIWWALYLMSSVADRVSITVSGSATTLPALKNATIIMIVSQLIAIALTGVAMTLLYQMFAMQERRRETFAVDRPACPSCGETVQANAAECPVCGQDLDFAIQPA